MKRKILLLLIIVFWNHLAQAQVVEWGELIGGLGADQVNDLDTDGSGNVYATGQFFQEVRLDPNSAAGNFTTAGNNDIYLAKYNSSGVYQWGFSIGGTTSDVSRGVLVIGTSAYIVGEFSGTVDFDPGAGVNSKTSAGGTDAFLAKYNSSGNLIWVNTYGSTGDDQIRDIALLSDELLVTGTFESTVDFDPGAGSASLTSNGADDIFVASYDDSGNHLFSWSIGSSGNENTPSIAVDENEDIIVTGNYLGTTDFDPSANTESRTHVGQNDIFIAKYNPSATSVQFLWVETISAASQQIVYGVATDPSDNIFITGGFEGTADFDPGAGISELVSTGQDDIFLAKYSSSGAYQWAHAFITPFESFGAKIDTDGSGNIYFTGRTWGPVDFDPSIAENLLSPSSSDIFLSKFDSNGNHLYAVNMGGSSSDTGLALKIEADGDILLGGSTRRVIDFDPYDGTLIRTNANGSSSGFNDSFIARYRPCVDPGLPTLSSSASMVCIGEEVTLSITAGDLNDATAWSWYSSKCGGTFVGTGTSIAVSPTTTTTYFARGEGNCAIAGSCASITITVNPLPTVTAMSTQTEVCEGEMITLTGNGANTYSWNNSVANGIAFTPPVGTTEYMVTGTDANGCENTATISIDVNASPSNITLSNQSIDENEAVGNLVVNLTTTDATSGDSHAYILVAGSGDTDNNSFSISSDKLLSATIFDFEDKSSYSIRVQSKDLDECVFEKSFTISIGNQIPEEPTDIVLSSNSIDENEIINTTVGTFSTTDDDAGETYTYSLVSGAGDEDNASFKISNNIIVSNEVFDFETKSSYSIRINTNDGNGGNFEKNFSISVNNLIEVENDILSFSFPEQTGSAAIDATNHTVDINVDFEADITTLTPAVSVSSGAVVSPLTGVVQDFTGDVIYTVTSESGVSQDWTVSVTNLLSAGTYSVGNTGDFQQLSNAFTALSANGISGDVVLEIMSDHFDSGGTAEKWEGDDTYSVTIRPAAGAVNILIQGGANDTFSFLGTENLTIDGGDVITIRNTATKYIIATDDFNAASGHNLLLKNIKFEAQFFMSIKEMDGLIIENSTFEIFNGLGSFGIGIDLFTNESNTTIRNNKFLFDINNGSLTAIFSNSTTVVENNFFRYELNDPTPGGLSSAMKGGGKFNNNTVLYVGGTASSGSIVDFVSETTLIEVNNNIFYVDVIATTAGLNNAILYSNTPATRSFENNHFYMTDPAFNYMRFQTGNSNTTRTYGPGDEETVSTFFNGTFGEVFFEDSGNGNLKLVGSSLSNRDLRATPLAGITKDLFGTIRSTNSSSKGAHEVPNIITDILDFTFTEIDGEATIDNSLHTITASAVAGTDLTALAPTISINAGASINPNSGSSVDFTSSVTYTVTAEAGNTQDWDVTITRTNTAPTNITLSANELIENEPVGTVIGTFASEDVDSGDTFTYSLVTGFGSQDNAFFTIDGTSVKSAIVFNFEAKPSHSFRVRTDDGKGGSFEKSFVINVLNIASETITWNGSSWDFGNPSAADNVIIESDYTDGSLNCNDLLVNSGVTVTMELYDALIVNGDLTNNGSINIESGASLLTYEANSFTGNDVMINRTTPHAIGRYSFVGSPVEQDPSITGSDLGSLVYRYDESVAYGSNDGLMRWLNVSSEELIPAKGYAQANKKDLIFEGIPNTGDVTYSGTYTEDILDENEGWNLVSNPYTAPIRISTFLSGNNNIEGAVYFWDDNGSETVRGSNADYAVANAIGLVQNSQAMSQDNGFIYISSNQGFFVKLTSNIDSDINFTESMRALDDDNNEDFFRTSSPVTFRINLKDKKGLFKQTLIGLAEDASNVEFNRLYDAPVFNNKADFAIYSVKQQKPLAIQGISNDWENVTIGFNVAEAGEFEIELGDSENQQNIYLLDKKSGKTINLSNNSYKFHSKTGQIINRFELLSSPGTITSVNEYFDKVYAFDKVLTIEKLSPEMQDYTIYDLSGTAVMKIKVSQSKQVSLKHLESGVYLVSNGVKTHKVILK